MLCPIGDWVFKVLADHAFERCDLAGRVKPAQHVVERTILEHYDDNMIQRALPVWEWLSTLSQS
jgi:hypothetical protein